MRVALLLCGIASSVLYALMIWTIRYKGYDVFSHVPSELTAIGAPTRALWTQLGVIYTVLITAFGVGLWKAAEGKRALRLVSAAILAYASLAIFWPFAAMHQREVLAAGEGSFSDILHVVLGAAAVLLMFAAIVAGATAFGRRFRVYSFATIAVLLAFGLLTFAEAPRLGTGAPTPWIGLWERICISAFLLWVAALATTVLRKATSTPLAAGKARFVATYDAALKQWPVPHEEVEIPTRFGKTHVVVAGPRDAPPLVLLHGYMATSVMWGPNIADFNKDHRVYAIDVMGQPSKNIPGEPIRNASDYAAWLTATLDGLNLDRVSLIGMSFGGWLALKYAIAMPDRVHHLALLSPGGLLPMVRQFQLRAMLMVFWPTRLTVNSFMHWAGIRGKEVQPVLDLTYLGLKHFRIPPETITADRDAANFLSDDELRSLRMPVLLLFGEHEVIYNAAQALDRARKLIPHLDGELVPNCRHDMCFRQREIVDALVLGFLKKGGRQQAGAGQRPAA